MTRTKRRKLMYACIAVVFPVAISWIGLGILQPPARWWFFGIGSVILLLPGRVQAVLMREFWRGRRALNRHDSAAAIGHFTVFLDDVAKHRWKRHVIKLNWSFYTNDLASMTLNNRGVAYLAAGHLAEAETDLHAARVLDPNSPLVYWNLALVDQVRGDMVAATFNVSEAGRRGYDRTAVDRAIHRLGAAVANVEGRP